MRKTFSGESARSAAKKSAAVRRAGAEKIVFRKSSVVDYAARYEFLCATTAEMKPAAPLDRLLKEELKELYSNWWAEFEIRHENPVITQSFESEFLINKCRCNVLAADTKPAALALRSKLEHWMRECRFDPRDTWILDAALFTLGCQVFGVSTKHEWRIFEPPDTLSPEFTLALPSWNLPTETRNAFRKRARLAFQDAMKRHVNAVQTQLGLRKEEIGRHATWTAQVFAGNTYGEISEADGRYDSIGEDAVRKAVGDFAQRVKLTLPRNVKEKRRRTTS